MIGTIDWLTDFFLFGVERNVIRYVSLQERVRRKISLILAITVVYVNKTKRSGDFFSFLFFL